MAAVEEKPLEVNKVEEEDEEKVVDEEEDLLLSSDTEIGEALDYLDSKDDDETVDTVISLSSRRPNAHGGLHFRVNSSTLQPLSNKNQKFSNRIRASPLEVSQTSIHFI